MNKYLICIIICIIDIISLILHLTFSNNSIVLFVCCVIFSLIVAPVLYTIIMLYNYKLKKHVVKYFFRVFISFVFCLVALSISFITVYFCSKENAIGYKDYFQFKILVVLSIVFPFFITEVFSFKKIILNLSSVIPMVVFFHFDKTTSLLILEVLYFTLFLPSFLLIVNFKKGKRELFCVPKLIFVSCICYMFCLAGNSYLTFYIQKFNWNEAGIIFLFEIIFSAILVLSILLSFCFLKRKDTSALQAN